MKPLTHPKTLLDSIENGEGALLRSVTFDGPSRAHLRLSVQDKRRGFDWIDLVFEITGIRDARLVDDQALKMIDTGDGITIVFENGQWGIAIGRYRGLEAMKSSVFYLLGDGLKYEEVAFLA